MTEAPVLEPLEEDWRRALAVVAHPDDMEYGAASAIARWTKAGKDVSYVLVTRGEAGIETVPPDVAGPLREQEQIESCAAVGVTEVEFLDHHDGMVVADIRLRLDLARAIRKYRPEVIVSVNFRESWGGPSWNHADHRAVGIALLDAVRDAANPWLGAARIGRSPGAQFLGAQRIRASDFADPLSSLAQGLDDPAWSGVRFVAFSGSPQATHYVDVSETIEDGVASLLCHREYLRALGESPDAAADSLRSGARSVGGDVGVGAATTFEMLTP